MKENFFSIFLVLILINKSSLGGSEKVSNSDAVTEIISEGDVVENETTANYGNSSTMENVTELSIVDEDVTEMLNASLTTISPSTTAKPGGKGSKSWKKSRRKTSTPNSNCHCDLKKWSCDVNCCCDTDCDESDKQIFTECLNDVKFVMNPNLEYCNSKSYDSSEKSPWAIDKKSGSLFCIYKENLPPILNTDHYKVIKTADEINKVAKSRYSWLSSVDKTNVFFDFSKPYSYNDDIWILMNSTLQLFEFPSSGINIFCNNRKTIKYLVNQKSYCLSRFNESKINNIYKNYKNMHLISSPTALNETWINNVKECPLNVCIPFDAYLCDLYNCSLLNDSNTPSPKIINTTDLIISVRIQLFSNGSEGFTKIKLYFELSNDPYTNVKYIEEHYEITHIWIPRNSSHHTRFLSGSSGYGNSMPIITSELVKTKVENSTDLVDSYDYFLFENSYPLRNVFYFPKNVGGKCVISNITYNAILFNENIEATCKFDYTLNIKNEDGINATNFCIDIQKRMLYFVPYNFYEYENSSKLYISIKGNPSQDSKDWIEIIPNKISYAIIGTLEDTNNTLICRNLLRDFSYEFIYARLDSNDNSKAVKLLGVGMKHSPEDTVIFNIMNNVISTDLSVKTMFYDVTELQNVEYAKGPHFHIHLPNDFFYPFTYNSGILYTVNGFYVFNCLLIYLYI